MNCVSKIYRTYLSDRKTSKNSHLAIDILLCSQNDQLIANPKGPRVQQSASFPGSSRKREDPGNEVAGKDILKDILFTFLFWIFGGVCPRPSFLSIQPRFLPFHWFFNQRKVSARERFPPLSPWICFQDEKTLLNTWVTGHKINWNAPYGHLLICKATFFIPEKWPYIFF